MAGNRADAQLAEAQRVAKRDITIAEGRARALKLEGEGESSKITQVGMAEATVSLQKIKAYGDPRLYALRDLSERLASSKAPLVPERLFIAGGGDGPGAGQATGLLQTLLGMLVAEKGGFEVGEAPQVESLEKIAREGARVTAAGIEKAK